jgi:hypothetical protein
MGLHRQTRADSQKQSCSQGCRGQQGKRPVVGILIMETVRAARGSHRRAF